jgi:hypothetical protein
MATLCATMTRCQPRRGRASLRWWHGRWWWRRSRVVLDDHAAELGSCGPPRGEAEAVVADDRAAWIVTRRRSRTCAPLPAGRQSSPMRQAGPAWTPPRTVRSPTSARSRSPPTVDGDLRAEMGRQRDHGRRMVRLWAPGRPRSKSFALEEREIGSGVSSAGRRGSGRLVQDDGGAPVPRGTPRTSGWPGR